MKVSRVLLIILHSLMILVYCIGLIAFFYKQTPFQNKHLIPFFYFGLSILSFIFLLKTRKMKAKTQESNEDLIDDFNFNINKTKDLSFAYISLVVGLIFILTGAQQSYQYLSTASLYQEMRFYWAYTVSLFSPALIMILIGVLQFYYSRLVLRSFK